MGPHGLQSCVAEQNGLVRHVIAAVGAAVYELLRQLQLLDLSGGYLGPLVQLFDVEIQLVPHFLHPANERHQIRGIVVVVPDLIQRQSQILQTADAPQLGKGVNGVVAVVGGVIPLIRFDQPPFLIVKDDAAGHAQCLGDLANGKQLVIAFHKKPRSQKEFSCCISVYGVRFNITKNEEKCKKKVWLPGEAAAIFSARTGGGSARKSEIKTS